MIYDDIDVMYFIEYEFQLKDSAHLHRCMCSPPSATSPPHEEQLDIEDNRQKERNFSLKNDILDENNLRMNRKNADWRLSEKILFFARHTTKENMTGQ